MDVTMRLALALLVLGSLTGCTVKYDLSGADWTKPGTMFQEVTYDQMECVRAAREAGQTPDLIVGGLADVGRLIVEERQRSGEFRRCMLARGYQPTGS
jgi:hypothetical protein